MIALHTHGEAPLPPMLVDRREAARLLGVSPGTIDNLRRDGLPSIKLNARRLFDVADLRSYIDGRKAVVE
jgi:phage terminase Nu1 subunit (DNA packaging protein)